MARPVLELRGLTAIASDGSAVSDIEQRLAGGEIACVLGDPAAGRRALLEFLAGRSRPIAGSIAVPAARPGRWSAAAAARAGIGVAADTALLPGLPIWRSFVAGREPTIGVPPLRLVRRRRAVEIVREELARLNVRDVDPRSLPEQLPADRRRLLDVARAFWIGSRAVLLDEPTRGLDVDQAARVLHRMLEARKAGVAVLFATGNVQHAWAVADRFLVLYNGRPLGSFVKAQTRREELYRLMLGNQDFKELAHELAGLGWAQFEPPAPARSPAQAAPAPPRPPVPTPPEPAKPPAPAPPPQG
jgi:simple sugar transport system ATP-binding protein